MQRVVRVVTDPPFLARRTVKARMRDLGGKDKGGAGLWLMGCASAAYPRAC